MEVRIFETKQELGLSAGKDAANFIREALEKKGSANIILATGVSQFEMLATLIKEPGIDWSKVVCFHLDEYVGLPESHPASFRRYLKERFASKVKVKEFYFLNGDIDPQGECKRVGEIIKKHPIDVAFVGIGENGHLAFNDPPADFDTEEPYIIVNLDETCRRQQLGEGWFKALDEVPKQAISMSIKQVMRSNKIICACPELRKAKAVKACLEGPVSNMAPASILQTHPGAIIYLDKESASLLSKYK